MSGSVDYGGVTRNTPKFSKGAHRCIGVTDWLGYATTLQALAPELGHLAFDDARIGAQAARGEDVVGIEDVSERLLAQGP